MMAEGGAAEIQNSEIEITAQNNEQPVSAISKEPPIPSCLLPLSEPGQDIDSPQYWLAACLRNRYLNERQVSSLCRMVKRILINDSNVIDVDSPVVIVGDIHGQYYDLRKLFEVILIFYWFFAFLALFQGLIPGVL